MKLLLAVKRDQEFLGWFTPEVGDKPILMGGSVVPAIFRTRGTAQNAIRNTREYAKRRSFDWGKMKIVRLVEQDVFEEERNG